MGRTGTPAPSARIAGLQWQGKQVALFERGALRGDEQRPVLLEQRLAIAERSASSPPGDGDGVETQGVPGRLELLRVEAVGGGHDGSAPIHPWGQERERDHRIEVAGAVGDDDRRPVDAVEVRGAFDSQRAAEAVGVASDQPACPPMPRRPLETSAQRWGLIFHMGLCFDWRRHGFPAAARDMGGCHSRYLLETAIRAIDGSDTTPLGAHWVSLEVTGALYFSG